MRRLSALLLVLLLALLAAPIGPAARAQQSGVEQQLEEGWRWRELTGPERASPGFRSVRPWGEGGLIASDNEGLAHTDGYEWTREPGWKRPALGEIFDVVPVRDGVFVICDGALFGLDREGRLTRRFPLRLTRRLMPACRTADGTALVAFDDRLLELESVVAEPRVARTLPEGASGFNAVALDGERALWAATDEGLFRDAGSGWQPMRPQLGTWPPPRPMVRAVAARGGIYFVPEKIELDSMPWFWDGKTLVPLEGEGPPGTVTDATATSDGTLVVATGSPTLKVYSAGVGRDVRPGLLSNDNILSLAVTRDEADSQERLALVTARRQLWIADLRSRRWEVFDTESAGAGRRVNALAPARQGGLWLGTDSGVLRFHDRQFSDVHTVAGNTGIPLDAITAVCEDERGRLWVASGATFRGVLCLEDGDWRHLSSAQDVGPRYTHSITRIGSALWFAQLEGDRGAIEEGQLVRLEHDVFTRFTTTADGRPMPRAYDIVAAADGRHYAALLDDVYTLEAGAWRPLGLEFAGARPFALHLAREGTLWIGLGLEYPGLVQWRDGVARRLEERDWSSAAAADLAETPDGRVWITSRSGAYLASGDECRELTAGLSVHEFWPVLAESDRSLWLGSLGSGLVHLQPDDDEPPRTFGEIRVSFPEGGGVDTEWDAADRWQSTPQSELRFRVTVDGRQPAEPVTWSGQLQTHQVKLGLLAPGRHDMTVVSVDQFGNLAPRPLTRVIEVPGSVWRSAPMLLAMGLLALTGVGAAIVLANRRRERIAAQRRQSELAERLSVLTRRLFSSAEDERRNLSRELHDDLGQALTSIGLDLQIAERKGVAPEAQQARERALKTVRETIDHVREISSMLRPPVLDDLGLEQAVRTVLTEFTTRSGVDGQLEIELDDARVPEAVSGHVYRILQEALTNVSRHASASTVFVTLRAAGERIELTVEDDGTGFLTSGAASAKRFGLLGMRERSELMGGSFRLESAPGAGTTIHVSIPLKPPDSAPDPA